MPSNGITLNWKTVMVIVTLASMIFTAGMAWSSVDTQLIYVTEQLAEIKATQKEHTDKLEALALSDAIVGSKIDGHVEGDHP